MPKAKKSIRSAAMASRTARHDPLGQVLREDADRGRYAAPSRRRGKKKGGGGNGDDEGAEAATLLDEKSSRKILELSKSQQLEVEAEEEADSARRRRRGGGPDRIGGGGGGFAPPPPPRGGSLDSDDDDDDDDEEDGIPERGGDGYDDDDYYVEHDDQGYVTVVDGTMAGLSAEDEALVASMMGGGGGGGAAGGQSEQQSERRTLADIILEKIEEKEAEKRGEMTPDDGDGGGSGGVGLPPKVVQVYTDIGKILSRYTSGKLPKAFKVIPSLSNWEEVLYLTRPDLWTPQATYQATRIFASNLNPKMAQRYYNLVLLDHVRADIANNKKLNYHYYMSLKKAVYKPAAFFKGILLPLCREDCTLREAAIVASVLQRVSIPSHHSAVAIHKLAQQTEYSGAASVFIRTLLNKKYSLPAPVIGGLVRHFASFIDDDRTLPVLWHQSLLVFVQRYKNEIQDESREALRLLMKRHYHHKITPEIRRELFGAQAWREERVGGGASAAASTAAEHDGGDGMEL